MPVALFMLPAVLCIMLNILKNIILASFECNGIGVEIGCYI